MKKSRQPLGPLDDDNVAGPDILLQRQHLRLTRFRDPVEIDVNQMYGRIVTRPYHIFIDQRLHFRRLRPGDLVALTVYNQDFALVRAEYPELDVAEWDQMLAECDEGGAR